MVGINAYQWGPLKNAVNDAKAVKEALELKGVEVFDVYDCSITQLKAKTDEFVDAVQEGDTAIVFFAGKGVEYDNATRLMAISEDKHCRKDAVNLLSLLERLGTSSCRCNRDKNRFVCRQDVSERDLSQHVYSQLLS